MRTHAPGTGFPFPCLCERRLASTACGWFGIQTWIGGQAIDAMLRVVWPGWTHVPGGPWMCFLLFWTLNIGGRLPRDRHRALPAGPRGAVGRGGRGTAALMGCVQSGRIRAGHACVEPLHCPLQLLELLRALGDGHSWILGNGRLERVALRPIPQSGYTGLLRAISTAVN